MECKNKIMIEAIPEIFGNKKRKTRKQKIKILRGAGKKTILSNRVYKLFYFGEQGKEASLFQGNRGTECLTTLLIS